MNNSYNTKYIVVEGVKTHEIPRPHAYPRLSIHQAQTPPPTSWYGQLPTFATNSPVCDMEFFESPSFRTRYRDFDGLHETVYYISKECEPFGEMLESLETDRDYAIKNQDIAYDKLAESKKELARLRREKEELVQLILQCDEGLDDHWVTLDQNQLLMEKIRKLRKYKNEKQY